MEELTPKQKQLLDYSPMKLRTKAYRRRFRKLQRLSNSNLKTQWQSYSGFWKIKDLSVDLVKLGASKS
jgi:hypothetical protein